MAVEPNDNTRWWILGAMGAILGVILLDETVVSVALPTIRKDLGLSELDAHWVVNIYLLVLACLAGAAGRLGDILGPRRLLTAGLLIFGLSSALGGLSQSGTALILARAVQGVGAAFIFPLSLVLVTRSFEDHERGKALGLYGSIGTVFLSLGPLIGGLLTEYMSWRWIFWVNPPIVLIVAAITLGKWRDPPHLPELGFDWAGFLMLVVGLGMVVFAIMEGPDRGWTQPEVLVTLLLGAALLILFIPTERKSPTPLIAVSLFASSSFSAANMIIFTAQFVKIVLLVFGALYFQSVLGVSPLVAGIALLPSVVPQVLIATLAGKTSDRLGTRGPSLSGVFAGVVAVALIALGMQSRHTMFIFAGFLIWGCAVPFLFVPPRRAVMFSVPPALHGQASGISMSFQLLGGTVGMALGSTVYAVTQSFSQVFWLVSVFVAVVWAFAFFSLDKETDTRPPIEEGRG